MSELDPKPWWQSRTQVGVLASTVSILLASFGVAIDSASLTELVLLGGALVSNAVALIGNLNRKQPIDKKQVLPGVHLP